MTSVQYDVMRCLLLLSLSKFRSPEKVINWSERPTTMLPGLAVHCKLNDQSKRKVQGCHKRMVQLQIIIKQVNN